MAELDPEPMAPGAGHRLGAPETLGISTLDPGHRPPAMPPGRHVTIRVRMLDDTEELFDISQKASGKVLFDLVCSQMNLIEGDYFGLEFQNHQKMMVWLDHIKPIIKQLRRPKHTTLRFAVKFFPPDHAQLLEELTRYLFALQIKQDLSGGRLTCNDSSAALMVSHIIQSEIGDFEESQCRSHLLNNNYIPDQMPLIDKIMEFHSKNIGHTPAESDYQLLEVARRLEMYGIRLHPAKDREGTRLSLAVAHTGVLVFQAHTKINAFNWSKVRKLSFKRKRFLIKLRPDLNSSYQDTLEFLMASRDCCKVFWKICVEYHAFFRLFEEPKPKPKPVLFTRGSSFRFSGRTQKQVMDYVRESEFKKIPFERKHSRVQHNSRLSPLPSPRHHEVPTESGAPGVDSPPRRHWKESVLVSAEDPSVSRTARMSPCHQRNGHDDRMGSVSRAEDTRGSTRQTHPEHLSTGPASQAATGSSFYIPYTDFSDVDSEYNRGSDQAIRFNHSYREQASLRCGSGSGSINGPVQTQHEHFLGRMRYRESPSSSKQSINMSHELDESPNQFYQKVDHSSVHSTMVDLSACNRERHSSSPLTVPHVGSRSVITSPAVDSSHQSSTLSYASQNGYGSAPPHFDESRFSPILSRSPRSQKPQKAHHPSDIDPNQGTSCPGQESRPVLSRAERMAALERRMVANGLSPSGRSRAGSGQKRLGHAGVMHVGPVQMNDCSTTSGSESSESEVETNRGNCSSPLMFSNPGEANSASPIPRNKFSFGSLQLDEEADEDGCNAFSDEDGGQVFSCYCDCMLTLFLSLTTVCAVERGDSFWVPSSAVIQPTELCPTALTFLHPRVTPMAWSTVRSRLSCAVTVPTADSPSPLTSPLLNDAGSVRTDDEDEVRRKRFPTDRAYFIAKELLTTERTYLKDLEVVTVSFQSAVVQDEATPDSLKNTIFSSFEPLHKFHTGFLREVEQRLALWEGRSNAHIKGDYQRIGDVMLKNLQALKPLTANLHKQSEVLLELEKACRVSRRIEALCRDFELQKVCYVPLNVFILRPLHRLIHYKQILERLCKHYPATHVDFRDCRAALADVSEVVEQLQGSLIKMENFQKLLELKKDLIGANNLVVPGRTIRHPVQCVSNEFTFNDVILYTSRGMTATNQFKVHGQLPLHGMTIRESEDEWGVPHAFTLVGQQQSVVVAASSLSEMEKWMEDIKMAIEMAKTSNGPSSDLLTSDQTDNKCPEDSSVEAESEDDVAASHTSLELTPHRGNTMVHVCWHRNTSVSMVDFSVAVENQLSGNLLRKFKNSNGWQKLWVVFTNFSLFFYKSHQDDYPLASLPLLGYSVTVPSESENIHKDYVFKLHFKSHVYYFRSESEYTFERWMEVIRSATVPSGGARVLNSKESHPH
ncbi:hypothetical protein L3Q82_017508 [Scortum barcoo]|uniref:Uncharacterized protein n=1 Tax=Scortum barcoo TaxID=214431 RepID=A0ACB8VL80_9TELE|nr:hypothetical protein L3Q82_017508 [Scortum barcoo]